MAHSNKMADSNVHMCSRAGTLPFRHPSSAGGPRPRLFLRFAITVMLNGNMLLKAIEVGGPVMSASGKLTINLHHNDKSSVLFFDFDRYYDIHPDAIAASLGMMLKNSGHDIFFDFPVSNHMVAMVHRHTGSKVTARQPCAPEEDVRSEKVILGFSGGFDSLTARDLLPEDAQLMSFDFMGPFSRERSMFDRFPTTIIQTNLVQLGLNRHSWAFMAVGARLLKTNLNVGLLSFGTVMEAREKYLRSFAAQRQLNSSSMTRLTKLDIYNPILGMTEVGTAAYISRTYPDDLAQILRSVANPGEEKSYRKSLLLHAVKAPGSSLALGAAQPPLTKSKWGQNIALDFLAIYLISKLGFEPVAQAYSTKIPDATHRLADTLDLSFYEKINMNFYDVTKVNKGLVEKTLTQAISKGIFPYSLKDYESFALVSAHLKAANHQYQARIGE